MTEWKETKRAGQTAFISRGNGLQAVHDSISWRSAAIRDSKEPSINPEQGKDLTRHTTKKGGHALRRCHVFVKTR